LIGARAQRQPKTAEIVAAIRETANSQESASTKGSSLGLISETPKYDSLHINLGAHIKASQTKRQLKILTTFEGELDCPLRIRSRKENPAEAG
jgi:hypothetical protein